MTRLTRRSFILKTPVAITAAAVSAKQFPDNVANETADKTGAGEQVRSASIAQPDRSAPFTKKELFTTVVRETYQGDFLDRVAFPMGGIGSGCISLAGTGRLIDWEIFNNPNRGFQPRFSFLSVWAKEDGAKPVFKVLEGQWRGNGEGEMYVPGAVDAIALGNGEGPRFTQSAGLPRMRECKFTGRFPFAHVDLKDKSLPITARIEGWSPFIPGNSRDSSLPIAVLNVTLTNVTKKPVKAVLAINVQNCAGDRNEIVRENGLCVLHLKGEHENGNCMFVASPAKVNQWQTNWALGQYFPALEHFIKTFATLGTFDNSPANPGGGTKPADENAKVGSLGFEIALAPGQSVTTPMIVGWYFPIFDTALTIEMNPNTAPWRNFYATEWKSGLDVARYATKNIERLEADTRQFQTDLFSSTVPGIVLEAASSQLAVLRSPTVIRYPDGTFYGWEGCAINQRRGYGTVNHVWNYQQSLPYLFPDLQKSLLDNCFFNGLRESDGAIQYRLPAGPNAKAGKMPEEWHVGKVNFFTAADGQFGLITQVYRDWNITGDQAWLEKIWPRVKKAMEYAWTVWDVKREGLLSGIHHCTLDIEFTTPETMCGSQYLAALLACERLAMAMDDSEFSRECRRIFESGKTLSDKTLFNGKYYQQALPAPGKSQLKTGCCSELVNGQLYARMLDLDDVYEPAHIHSSLRALFEQNYRDSFEDFVNANRIYALNDERGLLMATWPNGGRPEEPVDYCDETWTGSEYQAACNMIYDGMVEEGLTLIKSVRDRHNGKNRNPYCEFEFGNHYARSLIAYAGILAISGFRYSAVEKTLQLAPVVTPENFRIFFSVGSGWGVISQRRSNGAQTLDASVSKGSLTVQRFQIETTQNPSEATVKAGGVNHKGKISVTRKASRNRNLLHMVQLEEPVTAQPGSPIQLRIS